MNGNSKKSGKPARKGGRGPSRKNGKNKSNGGAPGASGAGQLVAAPVSRQRRGKTGPPSVTGSPYTGDGTVRIRHREYIGEIPGSVNFAAVSYSINPGLATVLSWLPPIAAQFEAYVFESLSFEFETEKSTATSGSVMMAVDFDASDATPVDKAELMSFHNAVRSPVWAENHYRCDSKDLKKLPQRYIRSGSLAANQDVKMYDVGNLVVATQGCADATILGELYCTYDVVLKTPQTSRASLAAAASVKVDGGGTVSKTAYLGTAPTYVGGLSVIGLTNTLTFKQVGQYIVETALTGTTFAEIAPAITGTAATTAVSGNNLRTGANTFSIFSYLVNVTEIGQTTIIDFSSAAATITASSTRIASYAYASA